MLNVMIAEDDLLMADMLAEVLAGAGYGVCGIARTVEEGIELGERCRPDLAVLDVRLAGGRLGTEIATALGRVRRPGILYATGYAGQLGLTRSDGEACLGKPFRPSDVVHALRIVEQIVATGSAVGPFPRGFYKLQGSLARMNGTRVWTEHPVEGGRARRQQAVLTGFSAFALDEPDSGKMLTEAARLCAEALEVPFCKICRYRPDENDLRVEAGAGWHHGVVGSVVSCADESSPHGRALVTGLPVVCADVRDAGYVLPAFYAAHGIVSTMDVVIKRQGEPYGVLEVDSPTRHEFDRYDVDFLTGFASVLARAIETSRHNVALREAVDRMQEMVADRDRLLAVKNLVLDEKSALLTEKSRLLDDRNVLAHELQHRVRNNLQLVYGMVSKQVLLTADPAGKEGLEAIGRRIMTLAQVYDHLLGTGLSRTIDFGGYLVSLCSTIESLQTIQHPHVALTCHSECIVLDLDGVTALGLVIAELISNSYEHAFPDGKGLITITMMRHQPGEEATIVFFDDGVGFVENGGSKRHGLGLVRRLMQQVNGSAVLRSGNGSEWTLRFPVPSQRHEGG